MTTVANNVAAKLSVAFVAVAMLFTMVSPAKAATAEEMQQMINQLLAQVASLQGSMGGSSAAAGMCPYTWTRSLKTGDTGMDVMKLQQFLNSDADTRVSASGVGSAGMESEYYGPATAAAVSKMQVKYRSDILSPAGLVNPTGTFGPATMAKANSLCVSAPTTGGGTTGGGTTGGGDTSGGNDNDDDMSSGDLGGEASLTDMTIDSASDDEIDEGDEDVEVGTATFEYEDGDAMITRIDVSFDGVNDDVWDVLDEVSLWVDGEEIARTSASDEDDYQDEDTGTLRFSGLELVAMEDEEVEVVIAASIQGTVDSDDQGSYNVSVDSFRWVDAEDVTETETSGNDLDTDVSFTLGEAGQDDEIIVKTSTTDPDGTTLQVEDDAKSDWYTVFAFDLDSDDSESDLELNEVALIVDTASSSGASGIFSYADAIDDVELVIDGVTIDKLVGSSTATTTAAGYDESLVLRFDVDGDVTIDAGDRVTAELKVRFKSLASADEGSGVRARVTSANAKAIDAEGADTLTASQLSGAAEGDEHTLRTAGIDVAITDDGAVIETQDGADNDVIRYTIELDVTAFEQDVYFDTDDTVALDWDLASSTGVLSPASGSTTVIFSSSGEEVSGTFEVTEGETETLTIEVTYRPAGNTVAARLQLNSVTFGSSSGTPTGQSWTASPTEDYRTDLKAVAD